MVKDNATLCECDLCGEVAQSIKGTQHRRCGGSKGAKLKDKRHKLPIAMRGEWQ